MDLKSKADNARRLAALNRRDAERHAAAGRPRLARHHTIRAKEWDATADQLTEQAAWEAGAGERAE